MAKKIVTMLFLLGMAFGIRWMAAREAYPTSGDGGHFVQYGVAMAHGHAKLNVYWSQAMVLAAAGAERIGLDPRRVLQGISFVAGLLVVLLFARIATRLTRSWWWGMAAGLWAATNPTLTFYSVTGYSEMGYMAFLLGAVYVVLDGNTSWKRDVFAGILLGIGGYFKGLDAAVAAVAFGAWRFWGNAEKRWNWKRAMIVPVVAFAVLFPLCAYTFSETGQFTPGSKGESNFLLGPGWKDSKVVYAADGLKTRSYAESFRALPRQVVGNMHDFFQVANAQFFSRGLRLGTIWFGVLVAGVAWGLVRRRRIIFGNGGVLLVLLVGIQVGLMLLVFVHDRMLAPTLPWLALLGLLGTRECLDCLKGKARTVAMLTFGGYCAVCGVYSFQVWRTEYAWWRYEHVIQVAEELALLGVEEEDVVMHYGPQLSIETHRENPLRTVEVPYGSIEDVGRIAKEKGVRFAAISDTWRGHWPIARIFDVGEAAPADWMLRKELVFEADEERGVPAERIRIYEVIQDSSMDGAPTESGGGESDGTGNEKEENES